MAKLEKVEQAEVKKPAEPVFPKIYVGPTVHKVGLIHNQVFSGPSLPENIRALVAKAPVLTALIVPVSQIKVPSKDLVKAFVSQLGE